METAIAVALTVLALAVLSALAALVLAPRHPREDVMRQDFMHEVVGAAPRVPGAGSEPCDIPQTCNWPRCGCGKADHAPGGADPPYAGRSAR